MKKYSLLFISMIVLFSSCVDEFLDRRMDTNYTEEQVFSSYTTMRNFGIGIYDNLPHGFDRFSGGMLAAATDDAAHAGANNTVQKLGNGNWGAFGNPDDQWSRMYSGIRKANLFLENSADYRAIIVQDTVTEQGKQAYLTQSNDLMWLRAESHFLRAFFYFELLKRYGGVPIITEVLDAESSFDYTRSSFDEVVAYIESELELAMPDLRETWVGFDGDRLIGRATKGAALSLKSRLLLYAASPLNNPSGDESKWIKAAEAAYEVIALNQYNLVDNYRNLFRSINNSEIIFGRSYAASNGLERNNFPIGFTGAVGGTNPSQNLVDAYETINGLSILEDPEYDAQNPYVNRDPRLQMSIIVNDSDYKGRKVESFVGGIDGYGNARATKTGYYLKKYVDEGLDLLQNRSSVHTWIYFRYAEILLNYAEAMNEAFGPDATAEGLPMTAREVVNQVRQRPGVNMPDIAASSTQDFRERIKNERRVELAFEEHRFWDLRRWEDAEEVLSEPIRIAVIEKNSDGMFSYSYQNAEERVFLQKMNRYPIPAEEINKAGGTLQQTPLW
ncbi:Starch-binding associating with outer membrane [Algoriphagus locisalis]|uniref:Starch-binding associating with outer membrane n=1 Tax=Algoriphagus locisalis TaxID=305507 RepID=A0A1I7E815_9BACT|nr:RagB/SusD family nutrient uptake outer membrane protein [Algoriphagus locisalis]SFU20059.1 Starch-binding associating with outer membrane [Algoriphagus locisalis]